ncbi:MAG: hypothetical protein AB7H43_14040 [Acidimicrobiia bacterium]
MRARGDRSSRPVWLGPAEDARGWDHVRLHVQLLRDKRLGHATSTPKRAVVLAIYWGLATHAELESGASRPSADTLGAYAGCDAKTARKAIAVLALAGYLEVRTRPGMASVYRLLPPPAIPAEADLSAGVTPDLDDDPISTGAGVRTEGVGRHARPTSGVTPDEQEPYNKKRSSRSDRDHDPSPSRSDGSEGEGDDRADEARGFELLLAIRELVEDRRVAEQLWNPLDRGGQVAAARTLAALEHAGWSPRDLVTELAADLAGDSPIAVLLWRARRLQSRPWRAENQEPLNLSQEWMLDCAFEHGAWIGGAFPPDDVEHELRRVYRVPEQLEAALAGARSVRAQGVPA